MKLFSATIAGIIAYLSYTVIANFPDDRVMQSNGRCGPPPEEHFVKGHPGPWNPWQKNDCDYENKTICQLDPETGHCRAWRPQYYYDTLKGDCCVFIYGGCDGNCNNFPTYEICMNICGSDSPM